jgi:hypothetical protein
MEMTAAAAMLAALGCGSGGQRAASADAGSGGSGEGGGSGGSAASGGSAGADAGAGGAGAGDGAATAPDATDSTDATATPGVPVSVTLTPGDLTLAPAGSVALRAEAHDATGAVVDATFTWQSSDTSVVVVDRGLVTGVTAGQAQITASAGSLASAPATVHVVAGGSTSELLANAVAAGQITADQALVYEVLEMFGDPALPAQYRGTATGQSLRKDLLMVEAASRFDALTADQQAAIGRYFVPPAYETGVAAAATPPAATGANELSAAPDLRTDRPGSCSSQGMLKSGWTSMATDHFRVWWNTTNADLQTSQKKGFMDQIAAEAENIYGELVGQMGMGFVPPLDDSTAGPCNGGDAKLDIYVVDNAGELPGAYAVTVPTNTDFYSGVPSPAFILISPNAIVPSATPGAPSWVLRYVVAHEFMHTVQMAYLNAGLPTYWWALEATATWAQYADNPLTPLPYEQVRAFLSKMDKPLFYPNRSCLGSNPSPECLTDPGADLKMYGGSLFFLWAWRTFGGQPIRDFYQRAAIRSDSLDALDDVIGEGLDQAWPDFVLALWNGGEVPKTSVFKPWGVLQAPQPTQETLLLGDPALSVAVTAPTLVQPGSTLSKDVDLSEMSAVYDHYTFGDGVSSFVFYNGFSRKLSTVPLSVGIPPDPTLLVGDTFVAYDRATADEAQGRSLKVLMRIGGVWTLDDWTDEAFVPLCFDKQSERLQELILIYANANHTSTRSSDFAANAIGPLGDRRATLVASPMPCWKYQGSSVSELVHDDGTDSFDITNTFEATFEGSPHISAAALAAGSATMMLGWKFTADPMTVNFTSHELATLASCGPGVVLNQSVVYGATWFPTVPEFDSFFPIPGQPGELAYSGQGESLQWEYDSCMGAVKKLPALHAFDFVLDMTAFKKVDVAARRLLVPQPGAAGPPLDDGSYPNPGTVSNTWCYWAPTEGGVAPSGCP